jgi:glycosyltransferase involved in cell wall biosynthesis
VRVFLLSAVPPARGVLRSLASLGVELIVARAGGASETDGLIQFVHVTHRGDPGTPLDLRWSRRALRTTIRDAGPQLLHLVADPWTPTAEAGAAAARDLKIPYVLVGTASLGGPKGITAGWQSDRIRSGAAAVAGTVRPALDLVSRDLSPRPMAVLPPGGLMIPAAWAPAPVAGPVIFGCVGRLIPERGVESLLDALSVTYGDWRLKVVGTGPSHEALEQQAQRLGLSARIEWLGARPREELPAFWREIDALVSPSRSTDNWVEPSGSIVLQAMAYGVAPVVTRCGALPHVVAEAGLIVDQQDVPALARALQGLVAEPERCRTLGAAARARVAEQYGDGPVAERMLQLWRRVLQPAD